MGSLSGFRPPQFSEDDAWLPAWLQQCNVERLNLEGLWKDHATFNQCIEEWQYFQKGISNGESLREEGGCNIGQLFISGTDSSPFSFAQSTDNVVQFHLHLSSDGNSENTTPTTDARQTESNCHLVIQPLDNSAIPGQKDANLSLLRNPVTINWSPRLELERPVKKNELLKHDENANFSEAAADAVELCIAASEALIINEVIESDSFAEPSSASAILEASLKVEQARLEVWKTTFIGSIDEISEMDNLSDLDDITMESAYEDAGLHINELPGNELSVSQVKDTFDSEYDVNLKHEETSASAMVCGKSCDDSCTHRMEGFIDNDVQLRKDMTTECFDGYRPKKIIVNQVCGLGTDVGYQNDCLRTVDAQALLHLSVSAEKAKAFAEENNSHEINASSSPVVSCHDGEKAYSLQNVVQERFQSRWFGGWTSKNEVKCFTSVKHSVPEPFAGETSFLSESADAAPDENSFVQNHDKGALIASQLSIPSENFSNRAKDGTLLSQDVVRSSNTSLADPLCSVVPCSISENICSAPAINCEDAVLPAHLNIEIEHEKKNALGASPSNNAPAQEERMAKESQNKVSRRFTSLINYSKRLPSHKFFFENDSQQKNSFFVDSNTKLPFQDTPFTKCEETVKGGAELPALWKENGSTLSHLVNCRTQHHFSAFNCSMHSLAEENPRRTALPESKVKGLPSENLQWAISQCESQSAQKLPAPKLVQFSEKETNISDNKKLKRAQPASKICCSTRAAKKSNRLSAHLESRAPQMDRYLKNHLDKEKKRLIFQNLEFLLTGFSQHKEKEIEGLIRKYGGIVLSQIPSINLKGKRSSRFKSQVLPIVLCLKKIQSLKFLYGCAVNAFVLNISWLIDSIAAGFVLPPKKYMILSRNIGRRLDQVYAAVKYNTHSLVFSNLGIMLHGKTKHFTNIATIIKHGGGQVFKTLQRLIQNLETGRISMGLVVAHEENCASRHLRHCALEKNIPMTSVYWIIKSLYAGQLIPVEDKKNPWSQPAIKLQRRQDPVELSQEI